MEFEVAKMSTQVKITDLFATVVRRRRDDDGDGDGGGRGGGRGGGDDDARVAAADGFQRHHQHKRPRSAEPPTLRRRESRELIELRAAEEEEWPEFDDGVKPKDVSSSSSSSSAVAKSSSTGWLGKAQQAQPPQQQQQQQQQDDDGLDPEVNDIWDEFPSLDEETLQKLAELEASAMVIDGIFATPTTTFVAEIQGGDEPKAAVDAWDAEHVKLSCSRKNCYKDDAGHLKVKWDLIKAALKTTYRGTQDLQDAILVYNDFYAAEWSFAALNQFFNEYSASEESQYFFGELLPKMVDLCLALPDLVRQPIPLLKKSHASSITLSQRQIASLLANAFFCTFPRRNSVKRNSEYYSYPSINFNSLFGGRGECTPKTAAKFRCLINYFKRATSLYPPDGTVTFTRNVMTKDPYWFRINTQLGHLEVSPTGTIEDDGDDMLQMDFANKVIGGGVLGSGAVQEEIRFMINPELIVSRLFTEELEKNEAVVIVGAERYSNYTGYASTFEWASNHIDRTKRDSLGRRQTAIVAVDALHYRARWLQYNQIALMRELNKAVIAFHADDPEVAASQPVAGGMWGCGAFNGDPQFKSLIQLIACAVTNRSIKFFTFGDEVFAAQLKEVHANLISQRVTVSQLVQTLSNYCTKINSHHEEDFLFSESVFEFVQEAHWGFSDDMPS